jgi:predicted dehydrogenase
MKSMFQIAVVGCGLVGRKRIVALPNNCALKYVIDVVTETANFASSLIDYPVIVAPSLKAILDDPQVDIVIIATPHKDLVPTAMQAVEHGKHVLIEKPGSLNFSEISALQRMVLENDVKVHVGFNHRFHPALAKAKKIIESNRYGALLWIRGRYGHGGRLGYEKEWRAKRAVSGGGELVDQGSHLIDLTRYLAGDVTMAFSDIQTSYWNMEVEDNAYIALRPLSGGMAWLHASWTEWKNTFSFEIALRTAKIDISGLGGSYGIETLTLYEMHPEMGPPLSSTQQWSQSDDSWKLELDDFICSIKDEKYVPVGTTLNDAVEVWKIIAEAYTK